MGESPLKGVPKGTPFLFAWKGGPKHGRRNIVIEKYIEGTTTPLKVVTFLVTDSSGQIVGSSNGEFITDENGRIVIAMFSRY